MNSVTKKLTAAAILTALALISFMIESLLPPIFIPGARLGVSNVFILLSVIICGTYYGYGALIVKCTLGSIFTGNISAIIYSLPAGLIALTAEVFLLLLANKISLPAISLAGGTINLVIQNITFCLIAGGTEYIIYLPYLALIGALSGLFVGFTVFIIVKRLPQKTVLNTHKEEE